MIGVGAGAHGKITTSDGRVRRTQKPRQPRRYLTDRAPRQSHVVADDELAGEFMMNVLRLADGVEEACFEATTGRKLTDIGPTIDRLRADGLMDAARLALTPLGFRFLDSVVARFV